MVFQNNEILSKLVAEHGQHHNSFSFKCKPIKVPIYIKISLNDPPAINDDDDVVILKDTYNRIYKCIPCKLLNAHRVVWEYSYTISNSTHRQVQIEPISITYCPYSRSCIVYEGNWIHTGLLYNSNIVLTTPLTTKLILQLSGEVIFSAPPTTTLSPIKLKNAKIYKWKEWKHNSKYLQTGILRDYITRNLQTQSNYNTIPYPIPNQQYLSNIQKDDIGYGLIDRQNNGLFFITKKTIDQYEHIATTIKRLHMYDRIQCCAGIWIAFFPHSKIM